MLARKRRLALADARQAAVAARDSETRFHTVFNQAAVGMLQIDSQTGLIVRANQRFCDLLGYRMEELVKLRLQQVSHPDDLERSADLLRQLNNGEIDEYRLEKRYQRKDGSSIWVSNWGNNSVQKINTTTGTAGGAITVGAGPTALAPSVRKPSTRTNPAALLLSMAHTPTLCWRSASTTATTRPSTSE